MVVVVGVHGEVVSEAPVELDAAVVAVVVAGATVVATVVTVVAAVVTGAFVVVVVVVVVRVRGGELSSELLFTYEASATPIAVSRTTKIKKRIMDIFRFFHHIFLLTFLA